MMLKVHAGRHNKKKGKQNRSKERSIEHPLGEKGQNQPRETRETSRPKKKNPEISSLKKRSRKDRKNKKIFLVRTIRFRKPLGTSTVEKGEGVQMSR